MEIDVSRGRKLIPVVGPPGGLVVDRAWLVLRVDGNNLLSSEIALPMIELALVSVGEPPLLPAVRAESG